MPKYRTPRGFSHRYTTWLTKYGFVTLGWGDTRGQEFIIRQTNSFVVLQADEIPKFQEYVEHWRNNPPNQLEFELGQPTADQAPGKRTTRAA